LCVCVYDRPFNGNPPSKSFVLYLPPTPMSTTKKDDDENDPWLSAWYDPVAQIKCFSSTMRLADLAGDGDGCLITADMDCRLRIFKGTSLVSDHALLDVPVAMCAFYTDTHRPRTPAVAVASGSFVFIYRNLRPYFKFTLPAVTLAEEEVKIWDELKAGKVRTADAVKALAEARDKGVGLSSRSHNLLFLEKPEEREMFVVSSKNQTLKQQTVVTCMETMNKDMDEVDAVSSLVIGTEAGDVLLLDPPGSSILKQIPLPSVPTHLAVTGLHDVSYRIVVACRDGNVYQIKDGDLLGKKIELESQLVDVLCMSKQIVVACMDKALRVYHYKGKKNFSIYLPHAVTNLERVNVRRQRVMECYALAMENGEVRVYNGKNMVSSFKTDGVVCAMRFGSYGRENNTLLVATQSGSLHVKMLRRDAKMDGGGKPGPPPEQDMPLDVPKKTKLYVEQTQRERDQAVEMHRVFQRDLCKLRLTTARAYVKIIGAEGAAAGARSSQPSTIMSASNVRLNVKVQGLGPMFRLIVDIQNTGKETIMESPLVAHFNTKLYRTGKALQIVPLLIPGLLYHYIFEVESIDENGAAGDIHILLTSKKSSVPLITALVKMPLAELPMDD
jgi:Bardet-Biedl syndrome 1 protein